MQIAVHQTLISPLPYLLLFPFIFLSQTEATGPGSAETVASQGERSSSNRKSGHIDDVRGEEAEGTNSGGHRGARDSGSVKQPSFF